MGHTRAIFWLFLLYLCIYRFDLVRILNEKPNRTNQTVPCNYIFLESCWGYVWAILGPCFDYFYNIFASRCLKWLKFSLESHASQIEEYHSISNYWNHKRAMFLPYQDHVWAISAISLLLGV